MGDGLCPTCTRYLRYALNSLPWDVADLTRLIGRQPRVRYRDPEMPAPSRVRDHPPIPIREDVEALRALIDYETGVWADSVARHDGVSWSTLAAACSRQGDRVQRACQLLIYRLDTLLGLPDTEHRARSLTARRGDGHDPEATTRYGDDYWTWRDGPAGGVVLLELHDRAETLVGLAPADRLPTPCPVCVRPALVREHRNNKVWCRYCHWEGTDDVYDSLLDHALLTLTGRGIE